MRAFPLLTGVITIIMLAGVGWVLWSEGQMVWAAAAGFFALVRLVLFVGQVVRAINRSREEDA